MAATASAPLPFEQAQTQDPFPGTDFLEVQPTDHVLSTEQTTNTVPEEMSTEQIQPLLDPAPMLDQSQSTAMLPPQLSVGGLDGAANTEFPAWSGDLLDASLIGLNGDMGDLQMYAEEEAAAPSDTTTLPVQAYAKLQFPDGDFYVNSYAIELGRDSNAMRNERRRDKLDRRRREMEERELEIEAAQEADPSPLNSQLRLRDQTAMSASNVSEAGGIIGTNVFSDEEGDVKLRRRRRKHLQSNESSESQSIAPAELHKKADPAFTSQLFADGHVLEDGDQFECPFIPIHPESGQNMKGISKKHIRIEYNTDKSCWELHVLGLNGIHHNSEHQAKGDVVRLEHNSEILVQTIRIVFKLPDNVQDDADGQDSNDSVSPAPSDLSSPTRERGVAIEDESDTSSTVPSEDEEAKTKPKQQRLKLKLSLSKRKPEIQKSKAKKDKASGAHKRPPKSAKEPAKRTSPSEELDEEDEDDEDEDDNDVKQSIEQGDASASAGPTSAGDAQSVPPADLPAGSILAGLAPEEIPQKRKGPGRPPKNGVMSKRDEAIVKRKTKELQKLGQKVPPLTELLAIARAEAGNTMKKDSKFEDGRDEDDPKATNERGRTSASATEGAGVSQSADAKNEGSAGQTESMVESEAAKARRLAKSPSPQKPESEYTEEELKKPPKTYVVLIHEAISKAAGGVMDLQQIYDAIQKMYPYYKYRCTTQGWQSSIRHNLIGSDAFDEAGKVGKGRLWKINQEYPIDKEKKRKAPTPPAPERPAYPNTYYPNGQYPYGNQGYSPYRPSPYGTPYGPPTTLPQGARPPAQPPQRPGTYYSPYASNPAGQTHASPYGPPNRPSNAPNPATATQVNGGATATATTDVQHGQHAQHPQNHGSAQTQIASHVQNVQRNPSQSSTPQPQHQHHQHPPHQQQIPSHGHQQPQQQSQHQAQQPSQNPIQPQQQAQQQQAQPQQASLGSEEVIETIMAYHRRYVGSFEPGDKQEKAKVLFRRAVNRNIDRERDYGEFENADEETVFRKVGEIIAESQREQRRRADAGRQNPAGNNGPASSSSNGQQTAPGTQQNAASAATNGIRPATPQHASTNGTSRANASASRTSPPHEQALVAQLQAAATDGTIAGSSSVASASVVPNGSSSAVPATTQPASSAAGPAPPSTSSTGAVPQPSPSLIQPQTGRGKGREAVANAADATTTNSVEAEQTTTKGTKRVAEDDAEGSEAKKSRT